MGLVGDGKSSNKKTNLMTDKVNKKRPFKCGSLYRTNSAASSEPSSKYSSPKLNRLTRSQSVENPGSRKNDFPLVINNPKKIPTTLEIKSMGSEHVTKVLESKSEGAIPKIPIISKKRRPFSFSRGFQANEPSPPGSGDDFFQQDVEESPTGRLVSSIQAQPAEVRSPRVHFADTLVLTGKNPESKTRTTSMELTGSKSGIDPNSKSYPERIRSASVDVTLAEEDKLLISNEEKSEKPITQNPAEPLRYKTEMLNDKLFIAKTDDLIMEVARFITEIKASRLQNFPVEVPTSQLQPHSKLQMISNAEKPDIEINSFLNLSKDSIEGLFNISCPSIVQLQSSRSSVMDSFRSEAISIPRPTSASLIRSVSNEDIHGRIALTLKMIEQEEKREMHTRSTSIPEKLHGLETLDFHNLHHNSKQFDYPKAQSLTTHDIRPSSSSSSVRSSLHQYDDPLESGSYSHFLQNETITSTPRLTRSNNARDIYGSSSSQSSSTIGGDTSNSGGGKMEFPSVKDIVNEKAKKIFSFLDEAEKTDRETLLGLQYEASNIFDQTSREKDFTKKQQGSNMPFLQKVDALIRKGSVELAKEQIIFERKLEESQQRVQVLEETLIHQRELNMNNLRNSDRDLKKRLCLQKEEFDVAFARNEALINEMVAEKRILQERCDKLMKHFDETEEKYKEQLKSLQQKHLEEIKRLRKAQIHAEHAKKQQWVGNKTHEIREMTVKGLEPEVQRIIQRHQQEMSEMRAWHSDELRETEERYQRKLHMQLQEMREKVTKEAEEIISKEKETAVSRSESALKQREEEFESHRRRLVNEIHEQRERFVSEEAKLKNLMQESWRKAEIKGEIELENLKQEYETKIANIERKYSNELKSLQDIHETENEALINSLKKKYETMMNEKEAKLTDNFKAQVDTEVREREKKLREDFEKIRKEDDFAGEARIRRFHEKFSTDLQEMDQSEKELKNKLAQAKTQLSLLEEETYSLKATLSSKEKLNVELQDANCKMLEERANLTSVIRREFSTQIEALENDVRSMRGTLVDLQTKHKMELEQKQLEFEKMCHEKDAEIDKIGVRVQQTISRKDDTIHELQKQIDKCNFQVQHLEGLLEEQRKNLVESITKSSGGKRNK